MTEFQNPAQVYCNMLEDKSNLENKIKNGEVFEHDLLRAVILSRREYIKAMQSAQVGVKFGHEFDIEDELYTLRAILTGGPL